MVFQIFNEKVLDNILPTFNFLYNTSNLISTHIQRKIEYYNDECYALCHENMVGILIEDLIMSLSGPLHSTAQFAPFVTSNINKYSNKFAQFEHLTSVIIAGVLEYTRCYHR